MIEWNTARVLIVEDCETQAKLLARIMNSDGYECVCVARGEEAFDAAIAYRPDVVLLDVGLPGEDGFTVCRRFKDDVDTRLIPVLMMTGSAHDDHYLHALEAGADDFLPKPIRVSELQARVRSAVRVKKSIDELDNAAASIVMLGATIEARDRYTQGHCERLADYASRLGARIGLHAADRSALARGGYLHDLGKIAIPDAVLFKPARLTPPEFELIKTHPAAGERICQPLRTLEKVRPIIRHHHEKLDGSGYPDGLKGDAVPLLAQIIGIADVYDALTTDRPYRQALSPDVAIEILMADARAGRYDRELVLIFAAEICDRIGPEVWTGRDARALAQSA